MKSSPARLTRSARRRRGQALVEFAMISLVMYLLLAAMLEYGRAIFAAQTLQAAADLAAREIARTPLSPTYSLKDALDELKGSEDIPPRLYSEDYLVINVSERILSDSLMASLPIVNQQLVPLMFFDKVGEQDVLRYPGAIVTSETAPSGYTVKVPYVTSRDTAGVETIEWHEVIEPVSDVDAFSITSADRGIVALRINYPFQAATMSSYPPAPQFPPDAMTGPPHLANDGAVSAPSVPGGGTLVAPDAAPAGRYGSALGGTAYSGSYGLGVHGAMGQQVRPFRKVISAQAVYRREVFGS